MTLALHTTRPRTPTHGLPWHTCRNAELHWSGRKSVSLSVKDGTSSALARREAEAHSLLSRRGIESIASQSISRDVPSARARAFQFSMSFTGGVAEAALYCAHRPTTIIDGPSKLAYFSLLEGHPCPVPLRPSNEHILIVRVPGARDWHGCHSFYRFHLMLQPTLAFCLPSTGLPASTASIAARRSRPVTGLLLPGRLSSSCPR
jgi:hypothetical protein